MSHLVFLPELPGGHFFAWDERGGPADSPSMAALLAIGRSGRARIVDRERAVRAAQGCAIDLLAALPVLATATTEELERAPSSWHAWTLAAKLALELIARERIVPRLVRGRAATEARFGVALASRPDEERVVALARAMPPAAHAVPIGTGTADAEVGELAGSSAGSSTPVLVWSADALLREFLDAAADALATPDVPARIDTWARKATSHLYSSGSPARRLTTFEAFDAAAARLGGAASAWLDRLERVEWRRVVDAVKAIPEPLITPIARTFALRLLEFDRHELLTRHRP